MPYVPGRGGYRVPVSPSTGIHLPFNFANPPNYGLNPNAGGSTGGSTAGGGSDWQHLLIRGAEFLVGAMLIVVGVQALIVRSKAGQTVIQTTGTVASVAKAVPK